MTQVTKSFAYNDPNYTNHYVTQATLAAAGGATSYPLSAGLSPLTAFSASLVVLTAGTATTATVAFIGVTVPGTTTTTYGTATLGTAAAGTVVQVFFTTATGGVQIPLGGYIKAVTGADATVASLLNVEYENTPSVATTPFTA